MSMGRKAISVPRARSQPTSLHSYRVVDPAIAMYRHTLISDRFVGAMGERSVFERRFDVKCGELVFVPDNNSAVAAKLNLPIHGVDAEHGPAKRRIPEPVDVIFTPRWPPLPSWGGIPRGIPPLVIPLRRASALRCRWRRPRCAPSCSPDVARPATAAPRDRAYLAMHFDRLQPVPSQPP